MTTRMLIDARHPEETRVAVLKGNRIEEFDFESADHKQIKGNIYLAKVTRVEPSLQAAFVDFGGNRHGFLAFSEIHPDYYQIPREDRERLLAEEAAHAEEEAALRAADEADEDAYGESGDDDSGESLAEDYAGDDGITEVDTSQNDQIATIEGGHVENGFSDEADGDYGDQDQDHDRGDEEDDQGASDEESGEGHSRHGRRMALRRRYKIQDVIHRRQVLLVQVVKEERGNKGAALTSYLSLAGRYCVLMPNSSHGGGISRKINSSTDRKRLKSIVADMQLPKSMGCIVRTAGLSRTKTEIKRDFDYLARLWDEIRETTLGSSAPAPIHSDSDLIKRAIRDIYNKEIEDVVVEGEGGYRAARDFMKLLMPSHAKKVKAYSDPVPLFQRYGAEDQLTAMYDPFVQLKSGGYIVINPTEALVSIDINSGRSTKEHGIEATALNTNLEAAREIARQLRLRDMAGLVVIDFIDMEYGANVRKVERAMKDALKNDRARIQVGRISSFGLMEMSRQRLRTGVLEATTRHCPHCDGTGLVRTASSAGLSALRLIEDEAARGKGTTVSLFASQEAAIYVLNNKRADLGEIEERYGVTVEVVPEGENEGAKMRVASSGPRNEFVPKFGPIVLEEDEEDDYVEEDEGEEEAGERQVRERGDGDDASGDEGRKRRKRRRTRGGRRDERVEGDAPETEAGDEDESERAETDSEADSAEGERSYGEDGAVADGEGPRKRRRRGRRRRGGRGRADGEGLADGEGFAEGDGEAPDEAGEASADAEPAGEPLAEPEAEAEPAPKKRSRRKAPAAVSADEPAAAEAEPVEIAATEEAAPKPKRGRRKVAEVVSDVAPAAEAVAEPVVDTVPTEDEAPAKPARARRKKAEAMPQAAAAMDSETMVSESSEAASDEGDDGDGSQRRGWWQRTFGA
jgi:ribonuclease E